MQWHYYLDRVELTIRPVKITQEDDNNVRFDWPTAGGWGRDAYVSKTDIFDTIGAAELEIITALSSNDK